MKANFIKTHVNGINDLDSYFNQPDIQAEKDAFVKNWTTKTYEGDN